jgi:hypothetical protein
MITVQLVLLAWHPGLHIFGIFRIVGIFGIDAFIFILCLFGFGSALWYLWCVPTSV